MRRPHGGDATRSCHDLIELFEPDMGAVAALTVVYLLLLSPRCGLALGSSSSLLSRRSLFSAVVGASTVAGGVTTPDELFGGGGAAAAAEAAPTPRFQRVPLQFIAALGDPKASSGTGAETWGLWKEDPGPRGVRLRTYDRVLGASGGQAPAGWTFQQTDWWLEEHGLIMEAPAPLPLKKFSREEKITKPERRYVVTGDREVTTVLTVHADGRWELEKGSLYDVTHLPCRSARYTPADTTASSSCTPPQASLSDFPVKPGAVMPAVPGCAKQDYAVLFVVAVES